LNFGDAHIGVEVPVSLAAGGSATVTFIHTYGSGQPATCNLADVNLDGTVDDADLLAVLFAFGNSAPNADVDVNLDGSVDDADLLEVLFNFGSSC
jgi:FlaG/FlaF family flagellin (archaellin)